MSIHVEQCTYIHKQSVIKDPSVERYLLNLETIASSLLYHEIFMPE